jgi:hypothetical protein
LNPEGKNHQGYAGVFVAKFDPDTSCAIDDPHAFPFAKILEYCLPFRPQRKLISWKRVEFFAIPGIPF